MKPALEATGLEHVFQSVVSGDDVYRGRPDPEAYLYAAQQLGRPSVRCVVIGNSNQVRGCWLSHSGTAQDSSVVQSLGPPTCPHPKSLPSEAV